MRLPRGLLRVFLIILLLSEHLGLVMDHDMKLAESNSRQ